MTRRDAQHAQEISRTRFAASQDCELQIDDLDECDIAALVSFFNLLDTWDREKERNAKVM
jgi:hypothetical protein